MAFGFNLGGSHSSQKGQQWIDPATSGAQWGALSGFQATPSTYTPTGAGLIGQYMNPYMDEVVGATQQDLEHQRQMAVNTTGDQATAAHAFGGSRHGVAEGITNGEYGRIGGLLTSQLRAGGFTTALSAAQQENMNQFQYPLQRQQVYNQTVAGITPHSYSKGSGTTFSGDISGKWGK